MKQINIKKIEIKDININSVSKLLDKQKDSHKIDTINWKEYSEKPEVSFKIAHDGNNIFIKYYVKEKHIRAVNTEINDSVWEDSCCEFFIAPNNAGYYNIEVNCIGTSLMGYGKNKKERKRFTVELIKGIKTLSSLGKETIEAKSGDFDWQLTIIIPKEVLQKNEINTLSGKTFKGNFYKCGDKTPVPHFLSWNPIEVEQPNFHRPDFFGELIFE